jgi:hypothetical protein
MGRTPRQRGPLRPPTLRCRCPQRRLPPADG